MGVRKRLSLSNPFDISFLALCSYHGSARFGFREEMQKGCFFYRCLHSHALNSHTFFLSAFWSFAGFMFTLLFRSGPPSAHTPSSWSVCETLSLSLPSVDWSPSSRLPPCFSWLCSFYSHHFVLYSLWLVISLFPDGPLPISWMSPSMNHLYIVNSDALFFWPHRNIWNEVSDTSFVGLLFWEKTTPRNWRDFQRTHSYSRPSNYFGSCAIHITSIGLISVMIELVLVSSDMQRFRVDHNVLRHSKTLSTMIEVCSYKTFLIISPIKSKLHRK